MQWSAKPLGTKHGVSTGSSSYSLIYAQEGVCNICRVIGFFQDMGNNLTNLSEPAIIRNSEGLRKESTSAN